MNKQHFSNKHFSEIENIGEKNNYFEPVLAELFSISEIENSRILDVGCGTGIFMLPIITKGCLNLTGIDGQNEFINKAIRRGYNDVKVINDFNFSSFPFSDKEFDIAICKDVFEHLVNPEFCLSEIYRILKPNGLLLIHVPHHFPLLKRFKFLFFNNIDTYNFFQDSSRWDFPHIRFYEYKDFKKKLLLNNFIIVKELSYLFCEVPFLRKLKIFRKINNIIAKKFPNNFSSGFTFIVKKNE
jgi:SAM-dependent methyltransferase